MSHVPHMNDSYQSWMSLVPDMNESCPRYEWVMSHIWMSHVPHMNESCPRYEWVMSQIWRSHVPHMNESCPTYEWVMSSAKHVFLAIAIECPTYQCHTYQCHTYQCHTYQCHTYQCHTCFSSIPIAVRCRAGLGRTVHMDVSCPTCERVVPHVSISHVQDINVSCHTCFPAICDKEGYRTVHVWHDSFVRATCLIHMCNLAHSHVWYDSIIWLLPCTV